jgi:hypothetical protein
MDEKQEYIRTMFSKLLIAIMNLNAAWHVNAVAGGEFY